MTDEPPLPPPPKPRGRPPVLLESARAVFARTDLADCRFVLGPWLASMHPRTLAHLVEDLEQFAYESLAKGSGGDVLFLVMKILARELPEARGFHEQVLCEACNRLLFYASIEQDRRDGLVAIEGVPALSSDNGVKIAALEGLEAALADAEEEI
jgi:hypothetical protein